MHLHGESVGAQFVDDVGDLGVSCIGNVFLEGHAKNCNRSGSVLALKQAANAFARDALTDAVIDLAPSQDHLRFVTGLLGAISQIIRIDSDAVAADKPRSELVKIPFCAGGGEHVASIDAKAIE